MRWVHAEYLLKGIFLGLLTYAALVNPTISACLIVVGGMTAGVLAGLTFAAVLKFREGYRPGRRWPAFVLFLLLEHPRQIYAGTLFGLFLATLAVRPATADPQLLPIMIAAGTALGIGLAALRMVQSQWHRFGIALASGAALIGLGLWALDRWPELVPEVDRQAFGFYLLFGLPFFYLLSFVGDSEESEVEAAAWCTALAGGVWLVKMTPGLPALAFLLPLTVYYLYTKRIMPGLRVFKCTLRGLGYARAGRNVAALTALRRAVQLNPDNRMARASLWEVHKDLDAAKIAAEPGLVDLIDPYLCLDRVSGLLTEPPSAAQLAEAIHLLDLLEDREPRLNATIAYWRAVAATHGKDIATATEQLGRLLDPGAWSANDPARRSILYKAWELALALHPELERRVGQPQLALPGRRLEAIDAVERVLAEVPQDSAAWGLKRVLYSHLSAADVAAGPSGLLDTGYVEQLGLALVDDPQRFRRGVEYLAIAARGQPPEAPRLFLQAAESLEKHGDPVAASQSRNQGKQAGLAVGVKQLPDSSRLAFFTLVKRLADDAAGRGDLNEAIANYQIFTEYDRSGLETLRTLAELHERRGDPLAAAHAVARGLIYNSKDADLLARRDKYYYSIEPDDLRKAPEALKQAVDVNYCMTKARQLLDSKDADADLLDWARHLTDLALALQPRGFLPRVLAARTRLRLGQRDQALQWLEDVREEKPEKFASSADEDAWLTANKLLGDLYLNELDRPDLAAACFTDFRRSSKSGADTLYKLGLAYEKLGQPHKAAKFFEQVTSYEGHPLSSEAYEGLRRVGR